MPSELAAVLRAIGDGADVDRERIRGALGSDAAAADALVELTHRVDALRSRSAELRVMMSSTRELLAEPDAALMLQRIVEHAHELIAGDIAYLSVYDPDLDELHVQAASGTISSRFLGMVVPAGVGLASRAVRTRHPQWVQDYASLTEVPHDPVIDAIVREEQLRAMLGAPLVVKGEVLGVLFTASRAARVYRPEEISLLSAFAGHAALVLHVARLLADATAAMADAAFRQQQAEWAAGLHGELTRLAVIGHDAAAIVAALSEALGRKVTFSESAPHDARVRSAMMDAAETGRSVVIDEGPVELVAPVMDATETPSALLVERGESALTAVERRTVERSALTAALVLLRRDALADAEERVRGELAAELLSEPVRREPALVRAAARGYRVDEPWTAVAVRCAADSRGRMLSLLSRRGDWLVAADGAGVAVLAPGDSAATVDALQAAIDAELLVVAHGGDLREAAESMRQVWQVERVAGALGIARGVLDVAALGPYALLFDGDGARLAQFVRGMLGPVLQWDADRGTALFDTLAMLFDTQWSLAAAARALHVHVNTLKQRLGRLGDLLGDLLEPGEGRFRLEMAVRIEKVSRELERT